MKGIQKGFELNTCAEIFIIFRLNNKQLLAQHICLLGYTWSLSGYWGNFWHHPHIIITEAAEGHGLEDTMCRWISSILDNKQITVTLAEENLEGSGAKGCLQGGVLLSLLHSLLVDELRERLNENGCYILGHAVGTAILISRKYLNTVS